MCIIKRYNGDFLCGEKDGEYWFSKSAVASMMFDSESDANDFANEHKISGYLLCDVTNYVSNYTLAEAEKAGVITNQKEEDTFTCASIETKLTDEFHEDSGYRIFDVTLVLDNGKRVPLIGTFDVIRFSGEFYTEISKSNTVCYYHPKGGKFVLTGPFDCSTLKVRTE